MKIKYSLILLLYTFCTTLHKIDLKDNQVPKYFYGNFDYNSDISLIQISENSKGQNRQYLKENVILYIKEINYSIQRNNVSSIQNSFKILLESLFDQVQKKYKNIKIQKDHTLPSTHYVYIWVEEDFNNPNTFSIKIRIQRITDPEIYFDFSISMIQLVQSGQEKRIDMLLYRNNIQFNELQAKVFLKIPKEKIDNFLENFSRIGKGRVIVTSITKNHIQIFNEQNIEIYKGESPVLLTLWEGNYILYAKKRGLEEKKISFNITENNDEIIPLKWKDEVSISYINFFSNGSIRFALDNELKGINPVYTPELPKGFYKIELSQKKNGEYEVLYNGDLELKENHSVNLFYPISFEENFGKESFIENSKNFFWFFNKKDPFLKEEYFENNIFFLSEGKQLFTPNIILDNIKGEFNLFCEDCEIAFYFEKDYKILLRKQEDLIYIYFGTDPLELKNIYKLNLQKSKNLFFYWDYSINDQFFSIYLNTEPIIAERIPSIYSVIEFRSIKKIVFKNFYVAEKQRENFFFKKLYFLKKSFD